LAVVVAFGLVYLHVVMAQRQFELDRLTAQVTKEQTAYQQQRLQVAQLESPQHIISTAEGILGLVQPNSVTYLSPSTTTPASPRASGGSTGSAKQGSQAPAGDADWPRIKSQLAGSP
jgi:hypothetical protein